MYFVEENIFGLGSRTPMMLMLMMLNGFWGFGGFSLGAFHPDVVNVNDVKSKMKDIDNITVGSFNNVYKL